MAPSYSRSRDSVGRVGEGEGGLKHFLYFILGYFPLKWILRLPAFCWQNSIEMGGLKKGIVTWQSISWQSPGPDPEKGSVYSVSILLPLYCAAKL